MFKHNFKYTLKTLFKNKTLIFWTYAFPIILGTFFYLAFSDIEKKEKLDVFPIAVVKTPELETRTGFKTALDMLGDESSKSHLFDISYVTLDEAKSMLTDKLVEGYILLDDSPKIFVQTSGIHETILQVAIDEILSEEKIIADYINQNKDLTNLSSIIEKISTNTSFVKDNSHKNMSYTMIEYYTLIAMACLYSGTLGMIALNQNLANMSSKGKKISIAPVSKWIIVLSSSLASLVVALFGLTLLFIFLIFILKINFSASLGKILLLSILGTLAGLSLGIGTSSLIKASEGTKIGILLSLTMFGCFLSGMMGITMKYVIDKNIPILNRINPANLITDGFYSLYYYESPNRYWTNITSLTIFIVILLLLSIFALRRNTYDSI